MLATALLTDLPSTRPLREWGWRGWIFIVSSTPLAWLVRLGWRAPLRDTFFHIYNPLLWFLFIHLSAGFLRQTARWVSGHRPNRDASAGSRLRWHLWTLLFGLTCGYCHGTFWRQQYCREVRDYCEISVAPAISSQRVRVVTVTRQDELVAALRVADLVYLQEANGQSCYIPFDKPWLLWAGYSRARSYVRLPSGAWTIRWLIRQHGDRWRWTDRTD